MDCLSIMFCVTPIYNVWRMKSRKKSWERKCVCRDHDSYGWLFDEYETMDIFKPAKSIFLQTFINKK